ncbi:hypothetical protein IMCC3317_13430 [Kordia antarctica]|uniref:Uncharacterized protein n=1 Tax=Kordia antarctica TaxID=1218801 RepID=A0A7L4ZH92_9FLAO|nr:hypothetical protein [Kordia antarctica]QHI35992.1 hypothetical protein IMCC3317_13430 [Kordia antarctica]
MKSNYLKISVVFFCVVMFQTSTAQNFKNANDYLGFIGDENQKISKSSWNYTKSVAHSKSPRKIEGDRKRLLKSIERAMLKIKRATPFKGEDAYRKQVLEYMDLRTNILKNDYAKIVDMKEVAEQSYDFMEAYILAQKMADERMQEAQETYENAQKDYAARNNIRLIESETDLSRKMKISNEVFDHKNEVYLVFFKSSIQERFMINALSTSDLSAIQQNANALQMFAEEGLQALDTITLYKEDSSVIEATKKALEFYLNETKNEIPKLLGFFLLNEKFTAIKNSIDKKSSKNRTKKEIDQYNSMVKEMNKAVVDFNKTNEELNKKRTKVINQWNEASAKFLSRHIPKE